MSEALILTFQSQLSSLLETVLKSAMYEITRLVEDSFLEEMGRGRQEVEMLRLKLQLSELKLREKEREKVKRVRCVNCGKASASSDGTHNEPQTEADTLCLSLSVREQRQCGQLCEEEEWSSREIRDSKPCVAPSYVNNKGDSQSLSLSSPSSTPDKQWTLQSPISTAGSAINQEIDSLSGAKHKNRHAADPGGVVSSPHIRESVQESQAAQTSLHATLAVPGSSCHSSTSSDLVPPSAFPDLKSESDSAAPFLIKEEEEALPVWNPSHEEEELCQDMANPPETHSSVPWNQEEMQVETLNNISPLVSQETDAFVMSYSVKLDTLASQTGQVQPLLFSPAMADLTDKSVGSDLQVQGVVGYTTPNNSLVLSENSPVSRPQGLREERAFGCSICPKRFSTYKYLKAHQKLHTEKRHPCLQCGRGFQHLCHLKAHMLTHTGKKPINCPHCDKSFVYNFELKIHLRQHSGEKPYVCAHCGKGFARLSNFKQHQNIHTREKVYGCAFCGMRFTRSSNLRVHLRRHSSPSDSCL
ncbi:gastrula zinc finger protein 5-1 [Alosa sapidissima]|uniref:gastrula zinc finger protein 5-1 n=1 Tax=Alosa sapidissima TaxID=34773 RepID=UPI001C09E838|nr:gastrula zinc finger protein 5-1 [Alosa sapidissima]